MVGEIPGGSSVDSIAHSFHFFGFQVSQNSVFSRLNHFGSEIKDRNGTYDDHEASNDEYSDKPLKGTKNGLSFN